MPSVQVLLLWLWLSCTAAVRTDLEDWHEHVLLPPCDLSTEDCNTARLKEPDFKEAEHAVVGLPAANGPEDDVAMDELEHAIGHGLISTVIVQETTREFARRMFQLIVKGAEFLHPRPSSPVNLTPEAEADFLEKSSARTKAVEAEISEILVNQRSCNKHMCGFPGYNLTDVFDVISGNGNIREVFAIFYCLTKHKNEFDSLVSRLPREFLETALGSDAGRRAFEAIAESQDEIEKTKAILPLSAAMAQGVPNLLAVPVWSWVRFDFPTTTRNLRQLWDGARHYKGCTQVSLNSDDAFIEPPLSHREVSVACGIQPTCALQWENGKGCYNLIDTKVEGSQEGFISISRKLGYRVVAGPSGTTVNAMQLARLMGFTDNDMVALRLTMIAWMVPVDDHSFWEVMLGADPYMPQPFKLKFTFRDYNQLWPADSELQTSFGTYTAADVWGPVQAKLSTLGLQIPEPPSP